MDVQFFLKERTNFIRYYYETAAEPFRETIRKIEADEAPFDDPPYSEDGEPAYLEEWQEADTALEILGRTCISMLSPSLKLYFKTWERELHISWEPGERKKAFEKGFLQGYRICFGEVLSLSWSDCPADLDLLEQVVLARNRDQHPDKITTLRVTHSKADREKYPRPFFVSDTERRMYDDPGMAEIPWMNPGVHVSREMLFKAIKQVEALADWLEEQMFAVKYPN